MGVLELLASDIVDAEALAVTSVAAAEVSITILGFEVFPDSVSAECS